MQFQYIDDSYLGPKFSFITILITTLTICKLTFHQIFFLPIYISPSLHFRPKGFRREVIDPFTPKKKIPSQYIF